MEDVKGSAADEKGGVPEDSEEVLRAEALETKDAEGAVAAYNKIITDGAAIEGRWGALGADMGRLRLGSGHLHGGPPRQGGGDLQAWQPLRASGVHVHGGCLCADADVAPRCVQARRGRTQAAARCASLLQPGAQGQDGQDRYDVAPCSHQCRRPDARCRAAVRTLIDLVGKVPNALTFQAELCRESIQWCRAEKRTFLKMRIQARLADIYLQMKNYKEALRITQKLVYQVHSFAPAGPPIALLTARR
jgi:hypothetical protein